MTSASRAPSARADPVEYRLGGHRVEDGLDDRVVRRAAVDQLRDAVGRVPRSGADELAHDPTQVRLRERLGRREFGEQLADPVVRLGDVVVVAGANPVAIVVDVGVQSREESGEDVDGAAPSPTVLLGGDGRDRVGAVADPVHARQRVENRRDDPLVLREVAQPVELRDEDVDPDLAQRDLVAEPPRQRLAVAPSERADLLDRVRQLEPVRLGQLAGPPLEVADGLVHHLVVVSDPKGEQVIQQHLQARLPDRSVAEEAESVLDLAGRRSL